jgi:hypothetical protein
MLFMEKAITCLTINAREYNEYGKNSKIYIIK